MGHRNRRRYDDKFRASAVIMLESEGYPDRKGALAKVAKHLSVPESTLHGWAMAKNNPAPTELRTEKKGDLVALIENEILNVLIAMPGAIPDANYRDLAVAVGILVDKKQLLDGRATEIIDDARTSTAKDELFSRLGGIATTEETREGDSRPN